MSRPVPHGKVRLADLMLLIATSGLSLACYVAIDNSLFHGQRYLFGLFERPRGGWDAARLLDRAAGVLALALSLCGGWTLVLPALWLREARTGRRRMGRRPGMTACIAATTGIASCAAVAGITLALRGWVDGQTRLPPAFWMRSPLLDELVVFPGFSVVAVWAAQAVTVGWRPSADWLDTLGRLLGLLWIASGLVFAARLLLR